MSSIKLLNEQKSSIEEVRLTIDRREKGMAWANRTNKWAIENAERSDREHGDRWSKGLLPKENFMSILLPSHGHQEEKQTGILLFPDNTPLSTAIELFKYRRREYSKDCVELISYLKESIRKDGFTSEIILESVNNSLKHLDGLHRSLALGILIDEGYEYQPVSVFLCRGTAEDQIDR